jgi:hypothetical protein
LAIHSVQLHSERGGDLEAGRGLGQCRVPLTGVEQVTTPESGAEADPHLEPVLSGGEERRRVREGGGAENGRYVASLTCRELVG